MWIKVWYYLQPLKTPIKSNEPIGTNQFLCSNPKSLCWALIKTLIRINNRLIFPAPDVSPKAQQTKPVNPAECWWGVPSCSWGPRPWRSGRLIPTRCGPTGWTQRSSQTQCDPKGRFKENLYPVYTACKSLRPVETKPNQETLILVKKKFFRISYKQTIFMIRGV